MIKYSDEVDAFRLPTFKQSKSQRFRNNNSNILSFIVLDFGDKLADRAFDEIIIGWIQVQLFALLRFWDQLVQFLSKIFESWFVFLMRNPLRKQLLTKALVERLDGVQVGQFDGQECFNEIIVFKLCL